MRKSNLKTLLLASFAFVFLLFMGVEKASAQSSVLTGSIYDVPTGSFVAPAEAQAILYSHCTSLDAFLQTLIPGTPAHKAAYRAYYFFRTIHNNVQGGKQVAESIAEGTYLFASMPLGEANKTEKSGLKQQAVNMLAQ
jgi:hypothetical protein